MNNYIETGFLIKSIRRWWWIVVVVVIITSVGGFMISNRIPPVYKANATIQVGQGAQVIDLSRDDILVRDELVKNYADIAKRQPVLQGVVDELSLDETWEKLSGRITVEVVPDTHIIEISVESNSASEAELVAAALAQQLILMSPTNEQRNQSKNNQPFVQEQLNFLQTKIEDGQIKLIELESALRGPVPSDEITRIQSEILMLETSITEWTKSYTQFLMIIDTNKQLNHVSVLEEAHSSGNRVWPRIKLNTIISAVLGLILGGGLMFLLGFLDNKIRTKDDLKRLLGLAPLGIIQKMDGKDYEDKLIDGKALTSPISEAFRAIRSNIEFLTIDHIDNMADASSMASEVDEESTINSFLPTPNRAIAVTSPGNGEGKSLTVANLGITMAKAEYKTIIVDVNFRDPVQHKLFKLDNISGVAEILRTPELDVHDRIQDTHEKNLKLLTSGLLHTLAIDLITTQHIQKLLDELLMDADIVILDCPALLEFPEGLILSKHADGVVVLVEAGKTTNNHAVEAISTLESADANLLGVILNRVPTRRRLFSFGLKISRKTEAKGISQPTQIESQNKWRWLPGR